MMALSCGVWCEIHNQQEDAWPEIQVLHGAFCLFWPFAASKLIQHGTVTYHSILVHI